MDIAYKQWLLGHGSSDSDSHSSSTTVRTVLQGKAAEDYQHSLDSLPDPSKNPLNLVSLARAEFGKIDRDKDGKIDAVDLWRTVPDRSADLSTRAAAALLDRRLWGNGFFSITDRGAYITNASLQNWNDAINLHNDPTKRDGLLRSDTATGAGMGFGLGALSSLITFAASGTGLGRLRWAVPLGFTAVCTGIGAFAGHAAGKSHLGDMERVYKDLL